MTKITRSPNPPIFHYRTINSPLHSPKTCAIFLVRTETEQTSAAHVAAGFAPRRGKLAWTDRAFYFRYMRGKNPPPALVGFIRIDYDAKDGYPKSMEVVHTVPCAVMSNPDLPDIAKLEHIYPSPTGLCSWHVIGAPIARLASQPGILMEILPHESIVGSRANAPTPINSAAEIDDDEQAEYDANWQSGYDAKGLNSNE